MTKGWLTSSPTWLVTQPSHHNCVDIHRCCIGPLHVLAEPAWSSYRNHDFKSPQVSFKLKEANCRWCNKCSAIALCSLSVSSKTSDPPSECILRQEHHYAICCSSLLESDGWTLSPEIIESYWEKFRILGSLWKGFEEGIVRFSWANTRSCSRYFLLHYKTLAGSCPEVSKDGFPRLNEQSNNDVLLVAYLTLLSFQSGKRLIAIPHQSRAPFMKLHITKNLLRLRKLTPHMSRQ